MLGYLVGKRSDAFSDNAVSPCLVHDTMCVVKHRRQQSLSSASPLTISTGSTVCKAWSTAGPCKKFAHPSERSHAVWLAERIARAEDLSEDIWFSEKVKTYPLSHKLLEPLHDFGTHQVIHVYTGPELQGWPTSRPRVFIAGLNSRRLIWNGPTTDAAVQEAFNKLFKRTCELTGDCFFLADDESVALDWVRRLKQRGIHCSPEDLNICRETMLETLALGARQRFEAYEKIRPGTEGIGGTFLADIEHWPDSGKSAAGSIFPCQLSHGTVVSWLKNRPALGMEHICANGFHVYPQISTKFECSLERVLEPLSCAQLKELIGNGLSLLAYGAFLLFILSHTTQLIKMNPMRERASGSQLDPEAEEDSSPSTNSSELDVEMVPADC